MNLQKFTERSREFIQEAQSAALAAEHQRILPQHLLKVGARAVLGRGRGRHGHVGRRFRAVR